MAGASRIVAGVAISCLVAPIVAVRLPAAGTVQPHSSPTGDQYDPSISRVPICESGDPRCGEASGPPFSRLDIDLLGGVAILLGVSGLLVGRLSKPAVRRG